MRPDELDRLLRQRLDALGPAPRAELLHVLILPDFERVGMIQTYWGNPKPRDFGELLIDCEEDRTLRGVLVGMFEGVTASTAKSSEIFGSLSTKTGPSACIEQGRLSEGGMKA